MRQNDSLFIMLGVVINIIFVGALALFLIKPFEPVPATEAARPASTEAQDEEETTAQKSL